MTFLQLLAAAHHTEWNVPQLKSDQDFDTFLGRMRGEYTEGKKKYGPLRILLLGWETSPPQWFYF